MWETTIMPPSSTGATSGWANSFRSSSPKARGRAIMLEYSGCLLHGLRQMGLHDVFEVLQRITCEPDYRSCVEWLGAAGGTRLRRRPRCRTIACTSAPGSITSRRSSVSRPSSASGDSRPPRWPCRITLTSVTSSSRRFANATIAGCWCKNTRSSGWTMAGRSRAPHSAPPGRPQFPRPGSQHRRHHQDPRQRHQARRPDAALL